MANFDAQMILQWEITAGDGFGAGGTTVEHRVMTAKVTGADREHHQVHSVSASLSAHEIPIDPLGSGFAMSNCMLIVNSDKKIDLRIGDSSNVPISGMQLLFLTGVVSALWVTTGSQVTTVRTTLVGGSGGSLTISPPLL